MKDGTDKNIPYDLETIRQMLSKTDIGTPKPFEGKTPEGSAPSIAQADLEKLATAVDGSSEEIVKALNEIKVQIASAFGKARSVSVDVPTAKRDKPSEMTHASFVEKSAHGLSSMTKPSKENASNDRMDQSLLEASRDINAHLEDSAKLMVTRRVT